MPKSKRNKIVSLTKTKGKNFDHKKDLIEQIRTCADNYQHAFVFSVENMRNNKLKEVRNLWKDSRFFLGKNNIAQIALGRSVQDEYKDGLHHIAKKLKGNVGLLFTNCNKDEAIQWFSKFAENDYARAGFEATLDVELPEGKSKISYFNGMTTGPIDQFPHSMEPYLRQLGMPTCLKKGHLVDSN
ncbi:mRNA turnover protein 4-like protein [Trichoplax sp. H2]|nr:mRNA turnover protein 4-like protein [Trichoplax sp. H2]|eukprot:RDD38151.1 mRNA turnover protein 4-like protein [Trichoplax sp. H2]